MNPWLVRSILALIALEVGVCVAFLADDWSPLRSKEDALFQTVLSSLRADEDFVLDDAPVNRVRHVRPLTKGSLQPYYHVKVDEGSTQELESYPPSPFDWQELLLHMHEVGCEVAAIEQPMSWEADDPYHLASLASLDNVLNLFEAVVLTVDLQRVPKNQPIPDFLKRSAIPIENVKGEIGALARVNRILNPPSATGTENVRFSFRIQESMEEARPAFVRWDNFLVPSFPLAVAMAQNKVAPGEVVIELGRHIRLGNNGPIVGINEIGELTIPLVERPERGELVAQLASLPEQVPNTIKQAPGNKIPRCALFADSSPESPSPWDDHNQLQKIISSFDVLPRPDKIEVHQRLTLPSEFALLGCLAILAAMLIRVPALFRHLGFILLAIIVPALLLTLFVSSQKWTPFAPVLATVLVGWVLAIPMTRYLPPKSPAPASK